MQDCHLDLNLVTGQVAAKSLFHLQFSEQTPSIFTDECAGSQFKPRAFARWRPDEFLIIINNNNIVFFLKQVGIG